MHYIVYNGLQPVVYSVAQNVSKIQTCAVFCKVLHVQTVVDHAALNVHTMLKKSQSVVNNVGNSIRQTAFHSVVQKKMVQRCLMYHSFLCLGLLSTWTVYLTTIYDLSSKLLYSYIVT